MDCSFKCLVVLVFLGPDARDTLTSPLVVRGSGDIARTVEGAHPADDKTEALLTENVSRPKDTRALVALGWAPALTELWGYIKNSHRRTSG